MTRRGKALPIIRHRVIPCPALAKDQAGFLPQLTRGCHTKCAPHIRTTIRLQRAGERPEFQQASGYGGGNAS